MFTVPRLALIWQVFTSHNICLLPNVFLLILKRWLRLLYEFCCQRSLCYSLFEVLRPQDFLELYFLMPYSWLQDPLKWWVAWKKVKTCDFVLQFSPWKTRRPKNGVHHDEGHEKMKKIAVSDFSFSTVLIRKDNNDFHDILVTLVTKWTFFFWQNDNK